MSEAPKCREPVILGLPHFENPLPTDPETGKPVSAFSAQPGEEVPPADMLAEVFTPRGEAGQSLPDSVDEVRVLADSIKAFYGRASHRSQGQFGVYLNALQRQEDRLDPPMDRYRRAFGQEVTDGLDGAEDFNNLMTTLFGGSRRGKLSDEAYQQWGDLFYTDPKTVALFSIFGSTAMDKGLIRKSWMRDRAHLVLPLLNTRIKQEGKHSPEGPATWFTGAMNDIEEVFERAGSVNGNSRFAYELEDSKFEAYGVLESMAWTIFILKYPSKSYMHSDYNYDGAHNLLLRMNGRFGRSAYKPEFKKFALDVNRRIGAAMISQGVVSRVGDDAFHCTRTEAAPMQILEAALRREDGHTITYEGFDAVVKEQLGADTDLGGHSFQSPDALQLAAGLLPARVA